MTIVVGLFTSAATEEHAHRDLIGYADLLACHSARSMLRTLAHTGAAAVIVDAFSVRGDGNGPAIRAVKKRFPAVPIISVVRLQAADVRQLVAATKAGAATVIVSGKDNYKVVLDHYLSTAHREQGEAIAAIVSRVPADVRTLCSYALEHTEKRCGVAELAGAFAVSRRSLVRRFRRAGLAPPGRYIAILRLSLAAHYLEHTTLRVEDVARRSGFASATVMRRTLNRVVAAAPTDLRSKGGMAVVLRHAEPIQSNIRHFRHLRVSRTVPDGLK